MTTTTHHHHSKSTRATATATATAIGMTTATLSLRFWLLHPPRLRPVLVPLSPAVSCILPPPQFHPV